MLSTLCGMHYIVDGGLTYDGAPEFCADGTLMLPDGQALAEGTGWRRVSVVAGEQSAARRTLSDHAKHLAERKRRNMPRT